MQNISKGSFVPFPIVVVLAVVGAHQEVSILTGLFSHHCSFSVFEGAAAAQIWYLRVKHLGTLLGHQRFECLQVSLPLYFRFCLVFLCQDISLHRLSIALEPPLLLDLLQLLVDCNQFGSLHSLCPRPSSDILLIDIFFIFFVAFV